MQTLICARLLADYISSLYGFKIINPVSYNHMGAVLIDAVLQAGMNYRTVVAPRVNRFLRLYPDARTTSGLLANIEHDSAAYILDWRHPEKPRRLVEVTQALADNGVEHVSDLRTWLIDESNVQLLLRIKGIGPKTADYMKGLAGLSNVAVDRHMFQLIRCAGIQCSEYAEAKEIIEYAADLLAIPRGCLDRSIWMYMAVTHR
jgi:endonuclease III